MQLIKNKLAFRCPLRLCLLIALAVIFVGCDSPNSKTDVPTKSDTPAVDKESPKSASKPATANKKAATPAPGEEPSQPPSPAKNPPKSIEDDQQEDSDSDSEDSPGPSLNAPKSVSSNPVASPNGSEENASLAIRFPVMER